VPGKKGGSVALLVHSAGGEREESKSKQMVPFTIAAEWERGERGEKRMAQSPLGEKKRNSLQKRRHVPFPLNDFSAVGGRRKKKGVEACFLNPLVAKGGKKGVQKLIEAPPGKNPG